MLFLLGSSGFGQLFCVDRRDGPAWANGGLISTAQSGIGVGVLGSGSHGFLGLGGGRGGSWVLGLHFVV